jgi:hypothetical protein
MAMTTKKATPIAPQVVVSGPKLERLHDGSRVFGILHSISGEDDCRIAQIGQRRVVLPSEPDLSGFMGQNIVLMMNRERCLVRLQGHDIYFIGVGAEEPQSEQPTPQKSPLLTAIELIRADQCAEFDYNGDLPAILVVLQESPTPLKTVEIAMRCHLSDEATRKRLKILVASGKVAHETIYRVVSGRKYEFATKRWRLVQQ